MKTEFSMSGKQGRGQSLSTLTDAELVILCQNGSEIAFNVLMKRYERMVTCLLRKLAPDWNDEADLTQECFIRIWRGIKDLKNPRAFKSWMCQIVNHIFYDELRRPHRRSSTLSLEQRLGDDSDEHTTRDIEDASAGPEEVLLRKESVKVVCAAIQTLSEPFKIAITLRDLEDKTYEDIAQITASDLGTVKSRISRARLKVKKVLSADFNGASKKLSA